MLRPLAGDKRKRYQDRFSQGHHHYGSLLELEVSLAGARCSGRRPLATGVPEAPARGAGLTELEMQFALLLHCLPNPPGA